MRQATISYYGPRTRIRRRGLVAYRNLKQRHFLRGAVVYLVVFFIFALAYVWTRVQVMETGYNLGRLQELHEKLKEENHSLLVETATLRSPQRLEVIATKLSLKEPTTDQVYFVHEK